MSRTAAPARLDDRRMWRRVLAKVHPDAGGDDETFVWLQNVRESICSCGNRKSAPQPSRRRERSTTHSTEQASERIPYDPSLGYVAEFVTLTMRALSVGLYVEEPYRLVLALLIDCAATGHGRPAERQCRGASYNQLAAIAHRFGMTKVERCRWYEVARSIPLSDQHAHHLLSRLQREAA
jgi:hypothetical protein